MFRFISLHSHPIVSLSTILLITHLLPLPLRPCDCRPQEKVQGGSMRQRYEKQEALLAKQVDSGDGLYHMMASATLTRGTSTCTSSTSAKPS